MRERTTGQISQGNHTEKWVRYFNKRQEKVSWLQQHRPQIYAADREFYDDVLFGILKIIARKNFKTANQLYKQNLKGRYSPSTNQTHSTGFYLLLYKIAGFKAVEITRRILDWVRGR